MFLLTCAVGYRRRSAALRPRRVTCLSCARHSGRPPPGSCGRAASHFASPAFARYWQARRSARPRVLVYADSRATNVTGPLGKSVFRTYVSRLMRSYCVQPVVLPFSHTTLLTSSTSGASDPRTYDAVVLHCGIVDFSPRPVSALRASPRPSPVSPDSANCLPATPPTTARPEDPSITASRRRLSTRRNISRTPCSQCSRRYRTCCG